MGSTNSSLSSIGHPITQAASVTISMPKEITVVEAVELKNQCKQLCTEQQLPHTIHLNFSCTRFIDSSGIGAIVQIFKLATNNGKNIKVFGVSQEIEAVFIMTGLSKLLRPTRIESSRTKQKIENKSIATHASVSSSAKRLIDILGSLVGLTITLVLFFPIAVAIKLDSPGPVLFSQTRRGWMGREFKLWKFRSMDADAESRRGDIDNDANGAIFKANHDPRITKIGKFLRRTSLDELPQFWNVLEGSMSLVGTRPPTTDEIEQYQVPEWRRLDVKPGITGEWQVNGRSNVKNFEDIINLDLRYQRNWSLVHDVKLLVRTIFVVFRKDSGAI